MRKGVGTRKIGVRARGNVIWRELRIIYLLKPGPRLQINTRPSEKDDILVTRSKNLD